MNAQPSAPLFRVWLTLLGEACPDAWNQLPRRAEALVPAVPQPLDTAEASAYVEAFNSRIVAARGGVWAVPIRVRPRFEGDLRPGQRVCARRVAREPLVVGASGTTAES